MFVAPACWWVHGAQCSRHSSNKMASRPPALPCLLSALLLASYGVCVVVCECSNATQLSVQVDTLLAEYERETPPATRVPVTLELDVHHATVDDKRQVMRLLADLTMWWQEPRVQWNASEWGCDNALTSAARLWLPDVALLNAATVGAGDGGLRARLDAAGAVHWLTRLDVTVPLALDLRDWPRDTQTGVFKFGSRVYNSDELVLEVVNVKTSVVFETGAWEILSVAGSEAEWQRGPETVSAAAWAVQVARRAPALALGGAAVLLAGAGLLAAAAALPPAQRPALAACTSAIAALWLVSALERLPSASAAPRGVAVMCALCVCGAVSGACAALVLLVARVSAPPPRLLRTLLSSLSTVCKLTPSPESCMSSESGAWAAAAVLLDRALSAALLLTLLVLLAVMLL